MATETSILLTIDATPLGAASAAYPSAPLEASAFNGTGGLHRGEVTCVIQPRRSTPVWSQLDRLEPGGFIGFRAADDLVESSRGRLAWAKDADDHWWIVKREDRRRVEHAASGYDGPGVRYGDGDLPLSDTPIDIDTIQYLKSGRRPLVGPWPGACVELRAGQTCSLHRGQSIVDRSGGLLSWGQDGRGDWWVLLRGDRDAIERCLVDGRPHVGAGVKLLDRAMRGLPIRDVDLDWLNGASTRLVGDDDARFVLRPGVDSWSQSIAQRLARASFGALRMVTGDAGDMQLAGDGANGVQYIALPSSSPDPRYDYTVQRQQMDWINMMTAMQQYSTARRQFSYLNNLVSAYADKTPY